MAITIAKRITGYAIADNSPPATPSAFTDEGDRRLRLDAVPTPPLASLRWAKRPHLAEGNPAWIYMVDDPAGKFAVTVGHVENGHAHPFEVWIGGESPRSLQALAKSLSMDMRSNDRAWLKTKLTTLAKSPGESFTMALPDGTPTRMPSAVAAFARLVLWRCEALNAFGEGPTPVLDALMSPKEPKTTTDGTLSWTVDVRNPITGDDFVMFVKEAVLASGQRRPFSVWLSGTYPRSLDGLCKCLSLDLRIVDIAWGLRKLQQLLDCAEPRGEFMAPVPGSEKQAWYPSTVAYMAALIIHRLHQLGLATREGIATVDNGVVALDEVRARREAETGGTPKGMECSECHALAARMVDGCITCYACGASKCN